MSRRAFVGGCFAVTVLGWTFSNLGPVAQDIARAYGISLATVGLLTTALIVTHLTLQIPAGKATDRFGARRMLLVGVSITAAANALALIAPEPALVVVARALAGVGTAFTFVTASDYVRASGGTPLAQGLLGGASFGGSGLALAVIPVFERWLGWRAPHLTALAVAIAALAAVALGPSDRHARVPRHAGEAPKVLSLLRDVRLYRMSVMHMASMGLSLVIGNWIVTLLVRDGGYGDDLAGVIGSLTLLGAVVSRPFGGWVVQRHPGRARTMIGVSLLAGAGGTLALSTAPPVGPATVAAAVVGLAAGIPFAPAIHGMATIRPDAPGAAVGQIIMFGNAVILAGTPLLGLTFSLPGGGRLGFMVVAGLWAAALLALPSTRELGTARRDPGVELLVRD